MKSSKILAMVLLAFVVAGCADKAKTTEQVKAEAAAQAKKDAELKAKADAEAAAAAKKKKERDAARQTIAKAEADVRTAEAELSQLKVRESAAQAKLAKLGPKLVKAEAEVGRLEALVLAERAKFKSAQSRIKAAKLKLDRALVKRLLPLLKWELGAIKFRAVSAQNEATIRHPEVVKAEKAVLVLLQELIDGGNPSKLWPLWEAQVELIKVRQGLWGVDAARKQAENLCLEALDFLLKGGDAGVGVTRLWKAMALLGERLG